MTDKKCMVCRGNNAYGMFESKCGHSVHATCLLSRPTRCGVCGAEIAYETTTFDANGQTFTVVRHVNQFANSPPIARANGGRVLTITPEIMAHLDSSGFSKAMELATARNATLALEKMGDGEAVELFMGKIFYRPSEIARGVFKVVYFDFQRVVELRFSGNELSEKISHDTYGIVSVHDTVIDNFRSFRMMKRFMAANPDAVSLDEPKMVYTIDTRISGRFFTAFFSIGDGWGVIQKYSLYEPIMCLYTIPNGVRKNVRQVLFDYIKNEFGGEEIDQSDFIVYHGLSGGLAKFHHVTECCDVIRRRPDLLPAHTAVAKKVSERFSRAFTEYRAAKVEDLAKMVKMASECEKLGEWNQVAECRLSMHEVEAETAAACARMRAFIEK
jgi:hypothetical protein